MINSSNSDFVLLFTAKAATPADTASMGADEMKPTTIALALLALMADCIRLHPSIDHRSHQRQP